MKFFKFFLTGIVFGIILTKAEIISWFRIYEMFRFESFHMYGVIGSAVLLGAAGILIMKRTGMKNTEGSQISIEQKEKSTIRYIAGGSIFGLGWALTGACPGPMYILIGNGFGVVILMLASALLGTITYGTIKDKLPH